MIKITHVLWQSAGSTNKNTVGFVRVENGKRAKTFCGIVESHSKDQTVDAIKIANHGGICPFDITEQGLPVNIEL